jgi:hypothetical protein
MMTWHMAQALRRRTIRQRALWSLITMNAIRIPLGWLLLAAFMSFLASSLVPNADMMKLTVVIAACFLVFTLFNGFFLGAIAAARIAGLIVRTRARGFYDLLCLLPPGPLAANWTLCAICLNRTNTFDQLDSQLVWIVRFLFFQVVVFAAARPSPNPWEGPLLALAQFGLLYMAFHIDDTQSLTLGSLCGLFSAAFSRNMTDARTFAIFMYAVLQASAYLIAFALGFTGVLLVFERLAFTGFWASLIQPVLALGLLCGLREAAAQVIWRLLLDRLDIAAPDQQQLVFT